MSIVIVSPTDSPEAVAAAMGDLATNKPVDDKKPSEDLNGKEPLDNEIEEQEIEEIEKDSEEIKEDEEEIEKEEIEAKNEKPKKMGGFQKKLAKKDKIIEEKDMELNFLRQEMMRRNSVPEPKVETKQSTIGKPNKTDFETFEAYEEARDSWLRKQAVEDFKAINRDEAVKTAIDTAKSKHAARVDEFIKKDKTFQKDWDEALQEVGAQNLSMTVQGQIIKSDVGPELMRALMDDTDAFKSICRMNPLDAAEAIGEIKARIKASKTSTETKPKSKVPEPVKTVRAKGGAVTKGYRDDMSLREYEAWRKESSGKGA